MSKFSRTIKILKPASSILINEKVELLKKRKKIISLSLGEAFFKLKDFGIKKHLNDKNYHYSSSRGLDKLRKNICRDYKIKKKNFLDPKKNIIISNGAKILTYMSMKLFLEKGDEVLTFEPAWLSYIDQANLNGAKLKYIPFYEKITNFEKYIKKKTKILIINNPNNPSGKLYSKSEINYLFKICKKRNLVLISDECYSHFIPKNKKFYSAIELKDNKNVIVINSLSKNFGMSGWRIGYALSHKNNIEKLVQLNQQLITCCPTILQSYVADNYNKLKHSTKNQIKDILVRRKRILKYLEENKFEYLDGECTFYIFLKSNVFKDISVICNKILLKYNISLVPGEAYGAKTNNFVRLSIGVETSKNIINALNKIKKYFVK